MTITTTIIVFGCVLFIGGITGLFLRSYQEGYLPKTSARVIMLFFILVFGILTIPFQVPFKMINASEKVSRKLLLFFASILVIPFFIIRSFLKIDDLMNSTVWAIAPKINDYFKIKRVKQVSNLRIQSPIPNKYSNNQYYMATVETLNKSSTGQMQKMLKHLIAH
ncbi:hypothetical protein [Paenibacillus sp. FSL F4-0243]|uniref:hypothetical protein n=1 Tax=Paenibacillus sp. FSL F4-0243 TaxID=2954732 RepID=UPI0030DCBD67